MYLYMCVDAHIYMHIGVHASTICTTQRPRTQQRQTQELWHPTTTTSTSTPRPFLSAFGGGGLYSAFQQQKQQGPFSQHRVVNPRDVKDLVFASGLFQPHDQHDAQVRIYLFIYYICGYCVCVSE